LLVRRAVLATLMLGITVGSPLGAQSAPSGAPIDGIRCDRMEFGAFHIHQHLAIFAHGKPVAIPSDVGRPLFAQCLYWIHTHTPDGIIHIEAPAARQFTLGEFFDIWGEPLSATRVGPARVASRDAIRVWVDGRRYTGDLRKIELAQHTDIVIEVGRPYQPPPRFTDWGNL
jgi:hypothetical protein